MRKSRIVRSLFVLSVALAGVVGSSTFIASAGPAAAPGVQACTVQPTGGTVTRSIGFRSYNLRVPAGLTAPAPLLLSMHGLGSFPLGQEYASGWSPFADQKKFIVAYPAGSGSSWSLGPNSADVAFLKQVVDHISARYCVNPKRVYAEGGSLGSFMSQRLACDAASKFAAVSGFMGGSPADYGTCAPSRPIGVSLFHGENDNTVPTAEGRKSRDQWVARDGCNPTPIVEPVSDGTAQSYSGCGGGVTVTWRSYAGLGHAYPTGAAGNDFRTRAWNHLMAHTLP